MKAIFSCREATLLASKRLDENLAQTQQVMLGIHTMICSPCRKYNAQIILIDHLFRARAKNGEAYLPTSDFLSATVRERIRKRIKGDLY